MSALLTHHGLPVSEPMAFGLANALAFAYIPMIRLAGQPLIAYRLPPRFIIRTLARRLGITIRFEKFRKPLDGVDALSRAVDNGHLVGLQTSVFWLPYFPEEMRFHFNAHNLVVYGRDDNQFLVSDPIFEQPVKVSEKDLTKARFAKGPLAPKGLMYQIEHVPTSIDLQSLIPKAISRNSKIMLGSPLPIVGTRGVNYLANKIARLGKHQSIAEQRLLLGHIVRMQEEIGTGGAGFRFMYASFLDEAAQIMQDETLQQFSTRMTTIGDQWREFALQTVKQFRNEQGIDVKLISDQLRLCGAMEHGLWKDIRQWAKKGRNRDGIM